MEQNVKRKRRLGDRYDGRRVRSLPPMHYVAPFVMKERTDACNLFSGRIDMEALDEYIRRKRQEGYPRFGFMHAVVTAFCRVVSQRPGVNRFISGQRIFQRNDIVMSMMVKKSMTLDAAETSIKLALPRDASAHDIYTLMDQSISDAKQEGDSTKLDFMARLLVKLPSLFLRSFVALMRGMDYFGIMPKVIHEASPFHCGIFIANLGSLGIPPVAHHIYNFGNVSLFLTFGTKYTDFVLDAEGNVVKKKFVDFTINLDERIADGFYLATAVRYFEQLLHDPNQLDERPETVVEDIP